MLGNCSVDKRNVRRWVPEPEDALLDDADEDRLVFNDYLFERALDEARSRQFRSYADTDL
jgi:hypothetical protein